MTNASNPGPSALLRRLPLPLGLSQSLALLGKRCVPVVPLCSGRAVWEAALWPARCPDLVPVPGVSLAAGQRAGTADWGSGLRRVLLQGVGEQRAGCVPCDHAGLGQQGAQELEAQQLQTGTEAGVTDAWQDRLTE